MSEQYQKGIKVMDYLQGLGINMLTIGHAIEDKNLEKSYQLITNNPFITKNEFLNAMGLIEEKDYFCPLLDNEKISEEECVDVCMVAEEMIKPSAISPKYMQKNDFKNICLNCKFHDQ